MTAETFFKRSPELLVVFTGDAGRIPYAISEAKRYKQSNVFITGTYSKNTVEILLSPYQKDENSGLNLDLLEIDYLAHNTIENVLSTLKYLRKKRGIQKILIISHDYHIARIKLIVSMMKKASDKYEFYYQGIRANYKKWRNIKIIYRELYKVMQTYALLLLWEYNFISLPLGSEKILAEEGEHP